MMNIFGFVEKSAAKFRSASLVISATILAFGALSAIPVQATPPNRVQLSLTTSTLTEGESQKITIRLTQPIISSDSNPAYLTVDLTVSDTTRATLSGEAVTFLGNEWSQPKDFILTANDDLVDNGNLSIQVNFTVESNSEFYGGYSGNTTVQIIDNDQPSQVTSPVVGQTVPAGSLAISGTGPGNQTIAVYVDDQLIGDTTSSASGDWNILATNVTAGNHTISYRVKTTDHYAFMANRYTQSIDVINVDTHEYVHEITDALSVGAAYNTVDNTVYSASNSNGNCRIVGYNAQTYEIVTDVTPGLACNAIGLSLSDDGQSVWLLAADGLDGTTFSVMHLDLAQKTIIHHQALASLNDSNSSSIAISPNGTQFWVRTVAGIQVFDASSFSLVDIINLPEPGFSYRQNIVFTADGTKAYTSNASGGVWEINTADLAVSRSFSTGDGSNMVALTPDQATLYVAASYPSSAIYAIRLSDGVVTTNNVPQNLPPESIAITQTGQWVVGDDHGSGAIFFGTLALGPMPSHTIYAPQGGSYYTTTNGFVTGKLPKVLGVSTTRSFTAQQFAVPNTGLERVQ